MSLLSVAEAQARILALGGEPEIESVPLVEAAGRWAAADVLARRTQPAADLSAMDGYAIRFAELPGPWRVVGESAAGAGLGCQLAPGEAARIFTGAPLPEGADTILVQEEAARDGDLLRLSGEGPPRTGAHVRRAGSDFAAGRTLIGKGDPLTPARIALAAIGGHGMLPVRRRLRIALISTGDELVPPGAPAEGVRLPASNGAMLAALLGRLPVAIDDRGIVPDDLAALTRAFAAAAEAADIVVTTGGASVGEHDLVRPALQAAGASLDFWRVAMKPGKPLMAGRLGRAAIVGLPGNPVSAFVTARLFLLPLVAHMAGDPAPLPSSRSMPLARPVPATAMRAEYLRARRTAEGALPLDEQDSAALLALASAELLIVRPPQSPALPAGNMVETIALA
ncbi:molybdopterin molybdenumtransferase MoeA [Sphingomonas oleivorans]|uniref:Molybdopterin molybdenumtransferase n=1 Tax=Sphingomonas oleivorans TaxID=1735121 RepID=A0A2T5FVN7_9SPHN|nr:molybdopterin molybdotransferase MoeA [Sphingomonas oleivorans]PTQ09838.1 molybdopterin molybdenumtransferase MoeA [Sphingomonas oleivorans]